MAGTLTVTAAPLTITANNQTKVYGAALPTLTASYSGFVNGDTSASLTTQPTLTTTATASSHVAGSPYTITASGAVDSDYRISYVAGTLTVTAAPLTITANNQTKVYGAALPTLTASYSGFVNGDTSASLTTQPTLTTTATASSHVAGSPYAITAAGAADTDYTISYVPGTLTVTPAPLTITANNQTKVYGAALPTLTAAYTGLVNGDTPASLTTPVSLSTTATQASHVGSYAITASGAADPDYTISYVAGTLTITLSTPGTGFIYVLDPTAGGALTLSGSASINTLGNVVVDSSSSSAILASGNAKVTATAVQVVGGVSKSGNASVTKTGTPGATGDPLAGLTAPTYSGTPISEILSGNSTATINPGDYSQITVSGNASLTMNAGVYIIEGGGLTVSGNASIKGSGVMIYNTSNSGGSYGSITLSGNGSFS